jgi:putative redox protein
MPKQLLLAAICGCTAIFKEVRLQFVITGKVDPERALESVRLSQTRYCGVSAMVSKSVPILYSVLVNDCLVGEGRAEFA